MHTQRIVRFLAAFSLGCVACLATDAPIFCVPFDGKDVAELSVPSPKKVTPFTTMRGPFIQGVKGQARVLGGANWCKFFLNEGFFPPRGSCTLWVSPQDWEPAASPHFVFFARFTFAEVRREYVRVLLYKYWNTNQLTLLVQNTLAGKKASKIQIPIDTWKKREWHHLAFTWDGDQYKLFADGTRRGECKAVELPARGRWKIALGTAYKGWIHVGKEQTAIDEFAVWPRVLPTDEIRKAYLAGAKAISGKQRPQTPAASEPKPIKGNLALRKNGAFVLASSFRNYGSAYPDNLIDGMDETVWEPFDDSLPQWIEMRWRVPLRLNEVILRQRTGGMVSALSIFGWIRDGWRLVRRVDLDSPALSRDVTCQFGEILTGRLRVVIHKTAGKGLTLTTLAARGPAQPIIDRLKRQFEAAQTKRRERVVLSAVSIEPEKPRAGDMINVQLRLRAPRPLLRDYAFLLTIGDETPTNVWDDYSVARRSGLPEKATSRWRPGQDVRLNFGVYLPKWAPDGPTSIRLEAFGTRRPAVLDVLDRQGNPLAQIAKTTIRRPDTQNGRAFPAASMQFETGCASLRLGEHKTPPAAWSFTAPSFDRYYHYSLTGIHLYHVKTHPLNYDDEADIVEQTCQLLDRRIQFALRVDPRAAFLVDIDLRPSAAWLNRNPAERLVTASGKLGPVSFSSRKYNEGLRDHIRRLFAFLRRQPYYGRIAGYLPIGFGAPDSTMGGIEDNLFQDDRSKLTFGDYNPQAIRDFQQWLRSKYNGSLSRLRRAWHDRRVTFETARPVVSELAKEGAQGGVFRDPLGSAMTFDYAEWLSGVMGRYYSRIIKVIRHEAGRHVVVGAYYGYNVAHLRGYNSPGPWLQNNNFDLGERLRDADWDFFAAPSPYPSRHAGSGWYTSFTYDSLRLHKKLLFSEFDHRTFIAAQTRYGRLRSERETIAVLKRDMAGAIIDGAGYWFADWSRRRGRDAVGSFMDPGILETIKKTHDIHVRALRRQKTSVSEIAVFTSGKTMRYHDVYRAAPIYHNLIALTLWDAMSKLGAPYDIYMLNDLNNESVRRKYKLYVFLNAFFLTEADRRLIDSLKRDGKTLLFFYAPGYVDGGKGLDVEGVRAVTQIAVAKKPGKELMEYRVVKSVHPILNRLKQGLTCKIQPFTNALSRELHPPAFGPVFYVDDADATALAEYPDGKTALAVKEFAGWRSVYCAVPRMGSALMREIARYAGVHLYCDRDIVLKTDNRLLMLHNGYEDVVRRTISLPRPTTVTDGYTGEVITRRSRQFTVTLPKIATRLYWLGSEIEPGP